MDAQPRVIQQSRDKLSYQLIGSIAFVVGCAYLVDHPTSRRYDPAFVQAVGWLGALFFGACAAMAVTELLTPSKLILSPDGLTWVGPFRRRSWRWQGISAFEIATVSRVKMIFFERRGADAGHIQRAIARPVKNHIPGGWQIDLPELCDVLNQARDRWRPSAAPPMSLT